MKIQLIFIYTLFILTLGFMGISVFNIYTNQVDLQESIIKNKETLSDLKQPVKEVVERIYIKGQPWSDVQKRLRNTVVQVFAQKVEVNWLEPYKTPDQSQICGSGFFINDEGEIITNAHVAMQTQAVWIQIPSLGKTIIDVDVVSVSPERDLALLKLKPESLELIKNELGKVPYLVLGDSDSINRADEVMALGFPLAQQSLKSTTGVVSGLQDDFIQISAPINPGSSGGPLLNINGEVVGITTAGVIGAQNVGYIIPVNVLRTILDDLRKVKLLRKPFLGILFCNGSEALVKALKNPVGGGCYVVDVFKGAPLSKAGVTSGDMVYEIDGHKIDYYGEINVPWSEDKITLPEYVSRLPLGRTVHLIVYRNSKKMDINLVFEQAELLPIRTIYTDYEDIDYEVIAGLVVMPVTKNNLSLLIQHLPTLIKFTENKAQMEPALIVTHILPDSMAQRSRSLSPGYILNEVNGIKVKTMDDFRNALAKSSETGYLLLKTSDNIPVAFSLKDVLNAEPKLSRIYRYPISDIVKNLLNDNK